MSNEGEEDRFCIGCGYNLRGLSSEQCPECGLPIDTARGSEIAWEGRRGIGTARTFWRTMLDGTFHVKRLAHAAAHPVDPRSAIRFRLIISLIATLPPSVLYWIIIWEVGGTGFLSAWRPNVPGWPFGPPPFPSWWEIPILWSAGATIWFVLPIGVLIASFLLTGVLSHWLRTGEMSEEGRKRAAAVSAYVGAPLAWLIVPTIAFGAVWGLSGLDDPLYQSVRTASVVLGCVTGAAILSGFQVNALMLISFLLHDGWARKMCAIVGLPLCWALAAAVGLVGFPMLIGLLWLMADSLRK
jgi:hypothetical protein